MTLNWFNGKWETTNTIKKERTIFILQENETEDLQSTTLNEEDWLGLTSLNKQGKLIFLEQEGNQMDHNEDWFIKNIVKPFLV